MRRLLLLLLLMMSSSAGGEERLYLVVLVLVLVVVVMRMMLHSTRHATSRELCLTCIVSCRRLLHDCEIIETPKRPLTGLIERQNVVCCRREVGGKMGWKRVKDVTLSANENCPNPTPASSYRYVLGPWTPLEANLGGA